MCNSANCSHNDDLNDDLDGLFDGPAQPLVPAAINTAPKGDSLLDARVRATVETRAAAAGHRYEEKCAKCRGTGRFVGYTGRVLGNCFECKGTGVKVFKSSPEAREKARNAAADKKAREAQAKADKASAWLAANPAEADWLQEAAGRGFEFAVSMRDALLQWGHLTERQEAAVRNATAKSAERQKQFLAEKAERESNKAEIAIDRIAEALATAKRNLIQWPKLRLADFVFSPAPDHGRNAGAIYVKSGDLYLGKIAEGRFTRSRDCTAELEAAIVAAAADPEAAASAYGLQTGICSCCGRKLTNKDSVGLGIGPICRDKWGF